VDQDLSCIDVHDGQGVRYLLWGEPGVRWVWVFGFLRRWFFCCCEGLSDRERLGFFRKLC
jgi:hypothetical protein